ncbi:hypothetical protein MUN82_08725 [Hymenobacter aerilatus]|uniref:Uncharacterized protein n=1 Tax=Hymenobacter aerilatus TaxID=2932251 RepID=A0A8T9T4Y6_9BACT|nr:hypothetical protein [Hymenobacter aerilatus]UOR07166.1 hypothetical protein MUN82_08725 [Hymenobacter aerilatus]
MKKLEALSPFSGDEGFMRRGTRFETSEARANLLVKAGLAKEVGEEEEAPAAKPKTETTRIAKPKPFEDRETKDANPVKETK